MLDQLIEMKRAILCAASTTCQCLFQRLLLFFLAHNVLETLRQSQLCTTAYRKRFKTQTSITTVFTLSLRCWGLMISPVARRGICQSSRMLSPLNWVKTSISAHPSNSNMIKPCTRCNWTRWRIPMLMMDRIRHNRIWDSSSHSASSKMTTTSERPFVSWLAMALRQASVMIRRSSCSSTIMRRDSCQLFTRTRHRADTEAACSLSLTLISNRRSNKPSNFIQMFSKARVASHRRSWTAGRMTRPRSCTTSHQRYPTISFSTSALIWRMRKKMNRKVRRVWCICEEQLSWRRKYLTLSTVWRVRYLSRLSRSTWTTKSTVTMSTTLA